MKRFIRILGVFFAVILSLNCFNCLQSYASSENKFDLKEIKDGYSKMLSNDYLMLSCNTANGDISLMEKASGIVYYSNPVDAESNINIKGINRTNCRSQLIISLLDKQGNSTSINSFVESVNKNGLKISSNNERVQCVYRFPDYKISITVYYRLLNDRLIAEIPTSEIKTGKTDTNMTQIKLLPFFGAASIDDQGYFVVPDGCGSIIPFHSNKSPSYEQLLFGTDRGKKESGISLKQQSALLPMMGCCYESYKGIPSGLLIFVESGASLATAYASSEDRDNTYNTMSFGFTYRESDTVTMMDQTSKAEKICMYEKNSVGKNDFMISYSILSAKESNIVGFAEKVRKYIFNDINIPSCNDDVLPVYIKTYLSVRKTKYFLGIPYNGNQKLSTLSDCKDIINDFSGIPVIMTISGLDSDGAVGGHIDNKFNVMSSVGSLSGYKSLIKKANSTGSEIYPIAEFTELSKGNKNNRVKSVANLLIEHYFYNIGNFQQIKEYGKINILNSKMITENVNDWIKSAYKNRVSSCAPVTLSNSPYRSGSEFGSDRESTMKIFTESLRALKKNKISILTESPASNAIVYSNRIASLPISTSGYSGCGIEIPFIQIVLHGVIRYSMPPINTSGSYDKDLLKAIETGSALNFDFITSDYSKVKDSPLDRLNGATYSYWKEKATTDAKRLADNMKDTINCKIIEYKILEKDVRLVTYENGITYVINYNNNDYSYFGLVIKSGSFIKINGGKVE